MLKVIRRGVFETNSSSTHSITICSKDEYDKWKNGDLYFNTYNDMFMTKKEIIKILKNNDGFIKYNPNFDFNNEEELNDTFKEYDYYTYDNYHNDECLESYEYTTPNGEIIVAFGKYGNDY